MSQHTPPPWTTHIEGNRIVAQINPCYVRTIAFLPVPSRDEPYSDDAQAADEALLRAAPDLHAALVGLLEITYRFACCSRPDCVVCPDTKARIDAARAAIAKATP